MTVLQYFDLEETDPNYQKKVDVHKLIEKTKGITETFEQFGDWLSEPITEEGFDRISRQNVNDWFRCKRLPYKGIFLIIRICSRGQAGFSSQSEFCDEIMEILEPSIKIKAN